MKWSSISIIWLFKETTLARVSAKLDWRATIRKNTFTTSSPIIVWAFDSSCNWVLRTWVWYLSQYCLKPVFVRPIGLNLCNRNSGMFGTAFASFVLIIDFVSCISDWLRESFETEAPLEVLTPSWFCQWHRTTRNNISIHISFAWEAQYYEEHDWMYTKGDINFTIFIALITWYLDCIRIKLGANVVWGLEEYHHPLSLMLVNIW